MTKLASALSRIEALAYRFDNADKLDMPEAAQNLANNCPAFWHRATSGNAAVGGFMFYLNRTQDVVRAWELYEHEFQRQSPMRSEDRLDELLPLNPAAAKSLAAAYKALGWPRREAELIARTDRAEREAEDALRALAASPDTGIIPRDTSRVDAALDALSLRRPLPSNFKADREEAA